MPGEGVTDNMIKSYRSNRRILRGNRKRLKQIFQENNYFYIKKKINAKTKQYDPEQKRIFFEKLAVRRRKTQKKQLTLLLALMVITLIVLYFSLFTKM